MHIVKAHPNEWSVNLVVTALLGKLYARSQDERVRELYARTMLSIGGLHYLVYGDFSRSLFGDAMVAFAGNEAVLDYLKTFLAGTDRDIKRLSCDSSVAAQVADYLESILRRTK
ncbi:hypothetical protein GF380_03475 [Candidatus Uhrbacteria bacterium]|nr:hypothetical protein [Candidatus Uhrbacteria bacterium]